VAPGEYVLLTVADTGAGMSAEVKAKAFEPFFTTKERGKGTGLGLSTVYGIVSQHGGAIWINSEPGRGCEFKVLFPRVEGAAAPAAPVEEVPAPVGRETVLVVEDEAGVRSYVCEILALHGYTVLEAATGRQALQVSERHNAPIHLLLTDAVMPEMGGHELAEQFASARPETLILFMSGYSERLRTAEAATNFIQKPFTPAALLTQVRSVLDGRSSGARPD
jgi:CheY-like chemotaxis protein